MTSQNKTQLCNTGVSWLIAIVCIIWMLPDPVSGSTGPVSDDGLRWADNDLLGPVHMVRGKESVLRQVGNEWIEDKPDNEWMVTYDRAKVVIEKERLHPTVPPLPQKTVRCLARDPGGRIVQSFECDADRSPTDELRDVFLYNLNGQLIEYLRINLAESLSLVSREVHDYNASGQKVAERVYDSYGAIKSTLTFDRDMEKKTLTVYARIGEWDAKEIHVLDHKGHRIESVTFTPDDEILSKYRMVYDSHGNWVERMSSGRGPDLREVVSYEYDRWGNWTQKAIQVIGAGGERRRIIRRTIEYFPD